METDTFISKKALRSQQPDFSNKIRLFLTLDLLIALIINIFSSKIVFSVFYVYFDILNDLKSNYLKADKELNASPLNPNVSTKLRSLKSFNLEV